jgi:predicted nucleotide-binding protein
MARARSTPPEPPEPRLKATKARAKELIDRGIREAEKLLTAADTVMDDDTYTTWTQDCERWDARTKTALDSVFEGPYPEEFHRAATGAIFTHVGQSNDQTFANRQRAIGRGINTLRSIEERIEFLEEPGEVLEARPRTPGGRQVFVVHGRDRELRERVARLLERLDLEPIILEEQPERGRTIIEKFEEHALDVGYAVALLTADDFGRGSEREDWPEEPNRARQNVVLELGYFMGALGRSRVAALSTGAVEKPSDIHGLIYISVDGPWEVQLAKEMRDARLPVDLNRL